MDGKLSNRTNFVEQNSWFFTKILSGIHVVCKDCKDNMFLNPNVREGLTMNAMPILFNNEIL